MPRILVAVLVALTAGALTTSTARTAGAPAGGPAADTVRVAPPTGDPGADRAGIVAALEAVEPGGTILFAPGLYRVGALVPAATPGITLLGSPEGTVLRGCDPAEYVEVDRVVLRSSDPEEVGATLSRCGMFELTGGHVTIRDLTFEYSRLGLVLGCCRGAEGFRPTPGGYRIEGNTFRNSGNSVRAILSARDPSVVRGNRFVNVFHAVSADASHLYVLDNEISVPEPDRVPGMKHPGFAISIGPVPPARGDSSVEGAGACERNVVAGNRIEGHPDGIVLRTRRPEAVCRDNVVRDNTIDVRRSPFPADGTFAGLIPVRDGDSTVVGHPILVSGVTGTLIEGNRITGAEGLGIQLLRASGSRVVDNTLSDIRPRRPFPGITVTEPRPDVWRHANGSGIWVSPGSDENQILDNTFEDVEGPAVFLEGDGNQVITLSPADEVRDLGGGNAVTARRSSAGAPPGGAGGGG